MARQKVNVERVMLSLPVGTRFRLREAAKRTSELPATLARRLMLEGLYELERNAGLPRAGSAST